MSTTITVKRKWKSKDGKTTTGRLFLGDKEFCYTLEDKERGTGEKVHGETAIPSGTYNYKVTLSNRFKRKMILIYNQNDGTLVANGISFAGVRVHGGNTHLNTEGCVLVAHNKLNDSTIQGTAEKEVTKWAIDNGGEGEFIVEDDYNHA